MNGHIDKVEDFDEVKVPVPWGVIAGKWWGPKTVQPIIAIHGWQDNCGTFDNLAPLLKKMGHSLFCIDLPGHGFSTHLPKGMNYYLLWDGVPFLRRIVKHFGWKEITIIGHSLGGCVAFSYAAIYPDDVKKYVSIDIAGPSVRDEQKMIEATGMSIDKFLGYEKMTTDQMPCYYYEEMIDIVVDAHKGSVTREGCEILMRRGMKRVGDSNKYLFTRDPRLKVASLGMMSHDQVLLFASRTTCEVLNIRAEGGLKLDHPERYSMILDAIEKQAKRMERRLVPGTHHLHLNDGNSVATIIHEFLVS